MDAGDRMILARLNQLESYLRLRLDGQSDGPYDDVAPSMNNDDLAGSGNRPEINLRFEECAFNPFELPQVKEIFSHTLHSQHLLDEELARDALHVDEALSLVFHDNPATVQTFFDTINIWYACVNPVTWPAIYQTAASGEFRVGPESCLVLLVLALGKAGTAGDSSSSHEDAGMQYFWAAWPLIQKLVINQSLISLQCIVLASVYLLHLARPVEAWTLLSSVTMKLQLHLTNQATLASEARKLLTRLVWNAILLESDILAELALPQSNLISHFSTLDIPSPFFSHSDSNEDEFTATLPRDDPWYLTASAYLFRLRMRISDMLYSTTTPSSLNALEPLIMDLDSSLSAWSSTYLDPGTSVATAVQTRLRFDYNAMRALIYRPVLHVTLSSYSLPSSPPMGSTNVITNGTVHTYPAAARSMLHTSLDSSMSALELFAHYNSSHFPFIWQGELAVVRCAIMVMAARDMRPPPPSSHAQQVDPTSAAAAAAAAIAASNTIHSPSLKTNNEQQHPPALSSLLGAPEHVDAVLVAVARELRGILTRATGGSGGGGTIGGAGSGSSLSPSRSSGPIPTSARAAAVMEEILANTLPDSGSSRGGGEGVFR